MSDEKTEKSLFVFSSQTNLLLATLVGLVASDGIISHFLITKSLAVEANPVMRIFVGNDDFQILKLAGGFLAAMLLWDFSRRHPKIALAVTMCCVVGYTAIIYWNLITYIVAAR